MRWGVMAVRVATSVAVASVLSFSAVQLSASVGVADGDSDCPPASIGACDTHVTCQIMCNVVYPPDNSTFGQCTSGCCYCILW